MAIGETSEGIFINSKITNSNSLESLKILEKTDLLDSNLDNQIILELDAKTNVKINLQGATVTSWVARGVERLYLR